MIEPAENRRGRTLRLRPIGMGNGNPPRCLGGLAAYGTPGILGNEAGEHKAPAISFGIGGVSGGTDEISELQISDGVTGDHKLADRNRSGRAFAVIRKSGLAGSHDKGPADRGAPAPCGTRLARLDPAARRSRFGPGGVNLVGSATVAARRRTLDHSISTPAAAN